MGHESCHSNEVVRRRHQIRRQLGQMQADEARSAKAADGLHPAKDLLDALALLLADRIPSMPRGAPINGAASPTRVLGHMRRDVAGAEIGHTLARVVALVASQRLWPVASLAGLIDELGDDVAF